MEDTVVNIFLKTILISIDLGPFGSSRCILQTSCIVIVSRLDISKMDR